MLSGAGAAHAALARALAFDRQTLAAGPDGPSRMKVRVLDSKVIEETA
jgi:hypothetical protein